MAEAAFKAQNVFNVAHRKMRQSEEERDAFVEEGVIKIMAEGRYVGLWPFGKWEKLSLADARKEFDERLLDWQQDEYWQSKNHANRISKALRLACFAQNVLAGGVDGSVTLTESEANFIGLETT